MTLGETRSAFRATAGSIVVTFAAQLALAVSGICVARLLGPSDRGRLALLVLFATVVTQLGCLGMPAAVTYWIARQPETAFAMVRGLRKVVLCQMSGLIGVQALILFFALRYAPGYDRRAAAVSLLGTPALVGWQYGLAVLQGQRRFVPWNICRLVFPVSYAITVGSLYLIGRADLVVVVVAWILLLWMAALSAVVLAVRGLGTGSVPASDRKGRTADGPEEPPRKRTMLAFGLKGLLGSVSPLQSFNLDQAIVGLIISPAALGIYVVAVAFTNLPFFIGQSVGAVAYPAIAARPERRFIARAILASVLAVLLSVGLIVFTLELALPWLIDVLFGAAFRASVGVARILLVYGLLVSLRRVLGDCARGAGLPGLSSLDELVALACTVPAALLLVDHGIRGVALAMVLSAGVGLVVIVVGLVIAMNRSGSRWREAPPRADGVLSESPG